MTDASKILSPLGAAALSWAARGFHVFPCVAGGKAPAIKNNLELATTDPKQIEAWWTENPDFNIGVSVAASGHVVVDTDPPVGEDSLAALELEHDLLPDTFTIQTPRGGLHRWFVGDGPSTASTLAEKVDTRGRGGYTLLPPSIVGGNPYVTVTGSPNAIADLPEWFATIFERQRTHEQADEDIELDIPESISRVRTLLRSYVARGDVAISGRGGNDRTYRLACEVLNLGLSPDVAYDVVRDEWNGYCNPPWDGPELRGIIDHAANYAQNADGAWASPPARELFADQIAGLAAQADPAPDPKKSRFWPRDESEQDNRPEPSWLLPNMIPDQATVMLYGESGSYKSFLALDIALTLATGRRAYGCDEREPVEVVYIAAEGARSVEKLRRPAWRLAQNVEGPLPFYVVDAMPLAVDQSEVIEFVESVKARGIKPALVCVDTLARAMAGMNENDAKDASNFVKAVDFIQRQLSCTVLVVHHSGKDEGRGARGSSALHAAFDSVFEVKAAKAQKAVAIYCRKQKDADEPETPWTFQGHVVGPSLVFFETDTATHAELTRADDILEPKKVGACLAALNAVGESRAVVSHVLASHLLDRTPGQTEETRQKLLGGICRRLKEEAKAGGRLEAYAHHIGRDLLWCLPATGEAPEPEL